MKRLIQKLFVLFISIYGICSGPKLMASEIDSFTERYKFRKDAAVQVNGYTQKLFTEALTNANETPGCDKEELVKSLEKKLLWGLFTKTVQSWVNNGGDGTVEGSRLPRSESMFKYIPFFKNLPMVLTGHTIGTLINIKVGDKTHYIGSDKLGHFFTQGHKFWEKAFVQKMGVQEALAWGRKTEAGYYGLQVTGIYSHADLAANFNGMVFWANLFEQYGHGKGPYFVCKNKTWTQVRAFDWRDFIDQSWDEGINCSNYRSENFANAIDKHLKELSQKDGQNYHCPINIDQCQDIGNQYGPFKSQIIHPSCLKFKH